MKLSRIQEQDEAKEIIYGLNAMLASIAGQEVTIQHPKDETEEPAVAPEDFTNPTTSIWVRKNIDKN